MKSLLLIILVIANAFVWAADSTSSVKAGTTAVQGTVLETKDVEGYTYLRLKTKDGEAWAAIARTPVKSGAEITIENAMLMHNFESKSLRKTFPTIYFGNLSGAESRAAGGSKGMSMGQPGTTKSVDTEDIHVPKAKAADARTVAEIVAKATELKDKPVSVSGKVVKYNPGIMGKNWIHLRDGTGSAADGTNDLLVTSASEVTLGSVVTVKGIVRTDKDFGSGYAYKVLIEEATIR